MKKNNYSTETFYNSYPFPQYSSEELDVKLNEWKKVFSKIDKNKVHHILDAGCGTGSASLNLATLFPKAQVTGINISEKSIEYANKMANELNLDNVKFIVANILDLNGDLTKQKYDIIICKGVLHHTLTPEKGMHILSELCNFNGYFYLSMYHPGKYSNFFSRKILDIFIGRNFAHRLKWAKKLFTNKCRQIIEQRKKDKAMSLAADLPSELITDVMIADRFCVPIENYHTLHKQYKLLKDSNFEDFETSLNLSDFRKLPGIRSITAKNSLTYLLLDLLCIVKRVEQTYILAKKKSAA